MSRTRRCHSVSLIRECGCGVSVSVVVVVVGVVVVGTAEADSIILVGGGQLNNLRGLHKATEAEKKERLNSTEAKKVEVK